MWYDNDECCDDCMWCVFDGLMGCYYCELDGIIISPQDIACRDYQPA